MATIRFEDGSVLMATPHHPLKEVNKGWSSCDYEETNLLYGMTVNKLEIGDQIISINSLGEISNKRILSISIDSCVTKTYYLSKLSSDNQVYFVNGTMVHNESNNLVEQTSEIQKKVVV